eukprot:s627_g11.t1
MPPKAKAKAKGKAVAKGKAKARGRAIGKAKAKGGAVARVRGRLALRRPAGADARDEAPDRHKSLWDSGHTIRGCDLSLDWLTADKDVVVEEAKYFHRDIKLAGSIAGTHIADGQVTVRLRPTGTTDEAILKLQSGTPRLELRLLLCKADCNHEESAEDLVHCLRLRKRRGPDVEEPWVANLEKVAPVEDVDELEALRARMEKPPEGPELDKEKDDGKKKKTKKEAKEKESKRSRRRSKSKGKEKKKKETSSQSSATGEIALDGSKARLAARKKPKALFRGTGLDPSDRVRSKVMRSARKYVKRKGRKDSSGSGSSSESSKSEEWPMEEGTIFQQAARVRGVADSFPGVLANQALHQMRTQLLQAWGEEGKTKGLPPVAVQYFRQVLQRRASGAVGRELLTLCAISDCLIQGKAAQAMDLALQRLKSAEATLSGTHWTVSQKLEVLPPEQTALTDASEMKEAQRTAQEEAKTRWMSSLPEGRSQLGQKGGGKNKGGKEDLRQRDGRKGKGQNQKGDWKKKEEGAAKGS